MKNDSLAQLLAKHEQGLLTDDERAALDQLTQKEAVMQAADRRVAKIRRGRIVRGAGLAVTFVALAGVGIGLLAPSHTPEGPSVAALQTEAAAPAAVVPTAEEPMSAPVTATEPAATPQPAIKRHITAQPQTATAKNEQVVICNNSCDADSVIDEIWKFLTA